MQHVFTYGSLMFDEVWSKVVAGRYDSRPATLPGYRRQRVRGRDYPSLQRLPDLRGPGAGSPGPGPAGDPPDPGEIGVAGRLYLAVDGADLARLDAFEGEDYRRIAVAVTIDADPRHTVPAATYLYLAEDRIEAGAWDPERFRRDALARFLRDHSLDKV